MKKNLFWLLAAMSLVAVRAEADTTTSKDEVSASMPAAEAAPQAEQAPSTSDTSATADASADNNSAPSVDASASGSESSSTEAVAAETTSEAPKPKAKRNHSRNTVRCRVVKPTAQVLDQMKKQEAEGEASKGLPVCNELPKCDATAPAASEPSCGTFCGKSQAAESVKDTPATESDMAAPPADAQ